GGRADPLFSHRARHRQGDEHPDFAVFALRRRQAGRDARVGRQLRHGRAGARTPARCTAVGRQAGAGGLTSAFFVRHEAFLKAALSEPTAAAGRSRHMHAPDDPQSSIVETDIPARLDRLPWARFHTLVVMALGITWILDGLEVTLAGTVAGALKASPVLQFSNADVGLAGSAYLAGAVLGALFFGWLTDRLGRKKLFFITLTVYLLATAATAFSWSLPSFLLFRFITGAGI